MSVNLPQKSPQREAHDDWASCCQLSPLIIYQRIGQLDLLRAVFGSLVIPTAVRHEVFQAQTPPAWIQEQVLQQPIASQIASARLGAGEREAIALALESNAALLILDDLPARRLAQALGIKVIGSAGILSRAKELKIVTRIRPLLEEMQKFDFRISDQVMEGILKAADEQVNLC